jgi:hypothetical protein
MPRIACRAALPLVLALAGGVFSPVPSAAQAPAERRPTQTAPAVQPNREQVLRDRERNVDAQETRREFMDILRRHPPSVARVMKLDPSLMHNEGYLAAYPAIADFLANHSEVPQNTAFYLEQVYAGEGNWQAPSPRIELIQGTLAGLAGLTAFAIVVSTLIWLIRTTIEQRRWNRLSKIQAEVHSKLMDRFSSNDELITYVQTPSGRRFLESGPSPLQEAAPRTAAAPFARILWSVQIGIVMLAVALGLLFVSGRAVEEAREFFFIFGCLALALGAGFTVSAAASYFLSRKLGLFDPPAPDHA